MASDIEGAELGTSIGQGGAQVLNFDKALNAFGNTVARDAKVRADQDAKLNEDIAKTDFTGLREKDRMAILDEYAGIKNRAIQTKYIKDPMERLRKQNEIGIEMKALNSASSTLKETAQLHNDIKKMRAAGAFSDNPEALAALDEADNYSSNDPRYAEAMTRVYKVAAKKPIDFVGMRTKLQKASSSPTDKIRYEVRTDVNGKPQNVQIVENEFSEPNFKVNYDAVIENPQYKEKLISTYKPLYDALSPNQKLSQSLDDFIYTNEKELAKTEAHKGSESGGTSRKGNGFNFDFNGGISNQTPLAEQQKTGNLTSTGSLTRTVGKTESADKEYSRDFPTYGSVPYSASFNVDLGDKQVFSFEEDSNVKFPTGTTKLSISRIVSVPYVKNADGSERLIDNGEVQKLKKEGKGSSIYTKKSMVGTATDAKGNEKSQVLVPLDLIPVNIWTKDTQAALEALEKGGGAVKGTQNKPASSKPTISKKKANASNYGL